MTVDARLVWANPQELNGFVIPTVGVPEVPHWVPVPDRVSWVKVRYLVTRGHRGILYHLWDTITAETIAVIRVWEEIRSIKGYFPVKKKKCYLSISGKLDMKIL